MPLRGVWGICVPGLRVCRMILITIPPPVHCELHRHPSLGYFGDKMVFETTFTKKKQECHFSIFSYECICGITLYLL